MQLTPEEVAYWYFRLNGFLTTANFVVHPDQAGNQLTDIDVLGVRFPYRTELLRDPMADDSFTGTSGHRLFIVFVEVKKGICEINSPLRTQENLNRVLRAVGMFPPDRTEEIAEIMSQQGYYQSDNYYVSICSLGESINPAISERYPVVLQIPWDSVFSFIYNRFATYRSRKADHGQWDHAGQLLWNAAAQIRDPGSFKTFIQTLWRVQ